MHFIKICKVCGKVISQCRCPSENKEKQYDVCEECKNSQNDLNKEKK